MSEKKGHLDSVPGFKPKPFDVPKAKDYPDSDLDSEWLLPLSHLWCRGTLSVKRKSS